jgi:nickel-dependent lactate racemase
MLISRGSKEMEISDEELASLVADSLKTIKGARKIIAVPPDITRAHSRAGTITDIAHSILGSRLAAVLPAIGTHAPMTGAELKAMYPGTPEQLFMVHSWRNDVVELDRISREEVRSFCDSVVDYDYPVEANRNLVRGGFDAILSIGQVVPHEVVGMANHSKNIFVGTGGKDAIDRSHFMGAAYGMERMMGRADTPVRRVFNRALELAAPKLPPILWILTVVGRNDAGKLVVRGFFAGDDTECFEKAADLAKAVNIEQLDEEMETAVVFLDPAEYRSTWLGNKAIYRTRMAMADGGDLYILAPGLVHFGEDPGIDALIRKYGYRTSREIRRLVEDHEDLASNLSAAAHLIHGSSEERFKVHYAPGPGLSKTEIESVGYEYADLEDLLSRFDIAKLRQGWNQRSSGEKLFFVSNPALGLWTTKKRFSAS